ncbi:MAG: glycosyltransferase family 8 protein [Amaricoccus sp.]
MRAVAAGTAAPAPRRKTAFLADRPPGSVAAVAFCCDARYVPFACLAARQIADLDPSRGFDICLCHSGDEALPVPDDLRADLRVCRIGTDALRGLSLDRRRTVATYLRLALPEAFEGQYERVLYLDSDIFVQGGDFGALLGVDMGARALAAVRDNIQWRTPGRRPEEFRRLGLPGAPYFNAGVMLLDVEAFNRQRILGRCLAFADAHPGSLLRNDQSLLNLVLRGDWAELAPRWNWQYTRASMLYEATEGANVIHFIGGKKPWTHSGGGLPLRFRRAYRAFLDEHFPDAPPIGPDGTPPHRNLGYMRSVLVRHLLAAGRFSDYLDRFESDLSVLRTTTP